MVYTNNQFNKSSKWKKDMTRKSVLEKWEIMLNNKQQEELESIKENNKESEIV